MTRSERPGALKDNHNMQIQLLGTASAEGWPGLFCACDVCRRSRIAGGKNLRARSSALLDNEVVIDLSPDILHSVLTLGLDLTAIRHLLITHAHHDHFALHELQYMSWMFVPHPQEDRPLSLFGPADAIRKIRQSLDTHILPLRMHCLEPWETVAMDSKWRVTPVLAQHEPGILCYNYLLSDGSRTLLYASDTGWYEEPTWRFLEKARLDGMVVECTKGPVEGGYMAHLCIPEVVRMRERLIAGGVLPDSAPVVTTHHSHLGGLLHEEMEDRLNPYGVQVGYDGLTFTV